MNDDSLLVCHTVIVKKEAGRKNQQNDKNNWQNQSLQEEHKNLIYNDMRNDFIVP